VFGWQEVALIFLALAGTRRTVFKTAAFSRSAIPPSSILTDAIILRHRRGLEISPFFLRPEGPG
jgi:hypothetical protein